MSERRARLYFMTSDDLTVSILREIRDEIRTTRVELKAEISATNSTLDATRGELSRRIDGTNERLDAVDATLKDLAGQQVLLTRYVKSASGRSEDAIED